MKALSEKLEILVSNLEKILRENKRNKSIEDFEEDCANMLESVKDCIVLHRKFINYHQEINANLSVSKKKLDEYQRKLLEMEQKSKILKKDLVRSCQCIQDFEENELKFKEQIASLESKILSLEKEKDMSMTGAQVITDADTDKEKKLLNSRLAHLETTLKFKEETEQEMKVKLMETVTAVENLECNVEELRLKLKDELERSQTVVKEKVYLEKDSRDKDVKVKELEDNIEEMQKKLDDLSNTNETLKRKITFYLFRISAMKDKSLKAEKDVSQQTKNLKMILDEKDKLLLKLEKKEEDMKILNQKLINTNNDKETYLQKYLRVQSQKQSADDKSRLLKLESMNLEREIMKLKKRISKHNAEVASIQREKELLAKNLIKMDSLVKKYEDDFKNGENEKISLRQDLKNSKLEIEKLNKVISAFESMKNQLLSDIKSLTKKTEILNDELSSHEEEKRSMKQQLAELTNQLNQQFQISSAAMSDRKMFCQQYKEMKENRDEMKQKVDNLDNYVKEVKETLYNKNEEITEWKNRFEKLDQQNKKIKTQLAQKIENNDKLMHENKHLQEELNSHLKSMSKKEKEIQISHAKINDDKSPISSRQEKNIVTPFAVKSPRILCNKKYSNTEYRNLQICKELTEECKILNGRVHRQIKEIDSLQEKLRISNNMIEIEKEKFENYQSSTKFLELEILRLTTEKNSLVSRINDLEKLKKSFAYAKDALHKERFKNSALERAIQQPINVHRWRILKGTDPEKHELLENYQASQKQFLKKCVETEQKDKKLLQMNKLIEKLKTMTLRQKELEEKYMEDARLKVELKSKTNENKALKFETNMYMSYMNSCQAEIKHLHDELQKIKTQQFLKQKSKVSIEKEGYSAETTRALK